MVGFMLLNPTHENILLNLVNFVNDQQLGRSPLFQ